MRWAKPQPAMRGKLGEDLESIKKLDTPFGQATTSSLEAFRAYALGDKAHAKAHGHSRGGRALSSRDRTGSQLCYGLRAAGSGIDQFRAGD